MIEKYKQFMLESNGIEGENRINPGDVRAVEFALKDFKNLSDICELHRLLGEYLNKDWVGKWRTCDVHVGKYAPPSYHLVPHLMKKYWKYFYLMNSFQAHNEFEKVHPFFDLNGRVGRLIWLSKAIRESYNFGISFLQTYYYQALNHYEQFKYKKKFTKEQENHIIREYNYGKGKFCSQIARELNVGLQRITNCLRRNKIEIILRYNNARPKNNLKIMNGYLHLLKPNHPNARADGWIRESHYIMSEYLKRPLLKEKVIHHIDGNISNNKISNLKLFTNNGEHMKLHNKTFKRDRYSRFIKSKKNQ